jgi:polar amino acid transport system substrate-binding protein
MGHYPQTAPPARDPPGGTRNIIGHGRGRRVCGENEARFSTFARVAFMSLTKLFIALACLMVWTLPGHAGAGPDCTRPLTLALHEHGLLFSSDTGEGIDKDVADELAKRSGCRILVSVMARSRIWQVIESGALDFSLSGISNEQRGSFAGFAWYFSNKYYLLARKDIAGPKLADFEKNPKLQLGVIRSFRYSRNANDFVDRLGAANRVTYATGLEPLYELLALNRIQGMIIEPFDYSQVAGSRIKDLSVIVDAGDPPVPHGLIMSKKSLSASEQGKWRALVDDMRRDGTTLRIFGKYFPPVLASSMVNF